MKHAAQEINTIAKRAPAFITFLGCIGSGLVFKVDLPDHLTTCSEEHRVASWEAMIISSLRCLTLAWCLLVVLPACGGSDTRKPTPEAKDATPGDTGGKQDSSSQSDAGSDSAVADVAVPDASGGDASIDDASTSDGSTSDGSTGGDATTGPTGNYVRFVHLSLPFAAQNFELCIAPEGSSTFTPLYGPLAPSGVAYGQVGKYIEIPSGSYRYRFATPGNCEEFERELSAILTQQGAYTRRTIMALMITGVIGLQTPDQPSVRDAAKDRLFLVDGTNSATPVSASLTGAGSPVDMTMPINLRYSSPLVDAPAAATLTVTRPGALPPLTRALRTVPGGYAFIVLSGADPANWQLTVCDNDAPIPSSGFLSDCGSTARN